MNITISKRLMKAFVETTADVVSTLPMIGEKIDSKSDLISKMNKSFEKGETVGNSAIRMATSGDVAVITINEDYIIECLDVSRNAYTMANALVPSIMHIGNYIKGAQKALDEKWHPDTKVEEKPEQFNNRRYDEDDVF